MKIYLVEGSIYGIRYDTSISAKDIDTFLLNEHATNQVKHIKTLRILVFLDQTHSIILDSSSLRPDWKFKCFFDISKGHILLPEKLKPIFKKCIKQFSIDYYGWLDTQYIDNK